MARRIKQVPRPRSATPKKTERIERPLNGTLGWLCNRYVPSAEFARLGQSTRITRNRVLTSCIVEPIAPGRGETFTAFPLEKLSAKALRVFSDRKADLPGAANDRVKVLRAVYSRAMERDLVETNPTLELKRIRYSTTGYHAWNSAVVEKFKARHPVGSKEKLALALLSWTGLRRSDVIRIGKQHVKDGWLKMALHKNSERSPVTVELPISPELFAVISASPVGDLTYLVTEYWRPFRAAGFGGWFRDRCNEVKLPQCSAHGLRKAGAVRAAENGATAHELMALFGWPSLSEAQRYTRSADRRTLAKNAAAGEQIASNDLHPLRCSTPCSIPTKRKSKYFNMVTMLMALPTGREQRRQIKRLALPNLANSRIEFQELVARAPKPFTERNAQRRRSVWEYC